MRRRTLLQSIAGAFVARPRVDLRAAPQSATSAPDLTAANVATLHAIGEVVLPASIGEPARRAAVDGSLRWVRNYREGADRGHGYGASTLSTPTGPSPALQYPAQFAALDAHAPAAGRRRLRRCRSTSGARSSRTLLNQPQPVNRLPARPTGANLVADFMGFYFTSADGVRPRLSAPRSTATAAARSTDRIARRRRSAEAAADGALRSRRRHHRRRHHRRDGRAEAGRAPPGLVRHRRRSRQAAVRLRESLRVPRSAASTTARTSGRATSSPTSRARGVISRTMAVGGSALHWGGVCNRFSEEDTRLKSMYGLAVDWPIEWKELETLLLRGRAASRRLRRAEPARRKTGASEPYPMPAMPMTCNLIQLKAWAEKSGIRFWTTPQAKNTVDGYGGRGKCRRCNTCEICPTGARYSPDWTFKQLLAAKKIQLHDQTLVRKLVLDDEDDAHRGRARRARGRHRRQRRVSRADVRPRVRLLLEPAPAAALGANSRFPNGLANSSDHVGRYMTGHLAFQTTIDLDAEDLSGHERAAQPDLAPVLPLPARSAVRAPRSARVGERRRPRAAAARCAPASCCSATR